MPAALTPNEEVQLGQTIDMFEVITQSQPLDTQSLEILKEAYFKLGRQKDVVNTAKRIAQAHVQLGQLSSAILEYESVLQLFPDDPDVQKALAEIENRASSFSSAPAGAETDMAPPEPVKTTMRGPSVPTEVDDGKMLMQRIFVDGKHMSEMDFKKFWVTPNLADHPDKPVEPFVQILADRSILPLEKSIKLLCERSRLCYLPLANYDIDMELARTFNKDFCRRWCVLPFDRMSKSVLVATTNPFNKQAIKDLEQSTRNRLLWYLSSPTDLMKLLQKVFR